MKAYLGRRYHFVASHRLHTDAFDARRNQEIYGKCNNPFGHGHNYVVDLLLSGPVNERGMVCDLAALDAFAAHAILERFDHTNLNLDPVFQDQVPTTENLCRTIHQIVKAGFDGARLERVRVEETQNNSFEYAE